MFELHNIEGILTLFNQSKKRDAINFCKSLTIYHSDFTAIILAAQAGALAPFKYANHFKDKIPEHLPPSDEERTAITKNGIGPLRDKSKKAITKLFQIFKDRRCLAAHLFYTADNKYWHMFYFDQRDNESHSNHWQEGPHIHYLSDLWPQHKLPEVWDRVLNGDTNFGSTPQHIRFCNYEEKRA